MQKRLNEPSPKKSHRFTVIVASLFIMLILLLFFKTCNKTKNKEIEKNGKVLEELVSPRDTIKVSFDSVNTQKDSILDTFIEKKKFNPEIKKNISIFSKKIDTIITPALVESDTAVDSVAHVEISKSVDTMAYIADTSECGKDTSELWVYPDPSGGLHRQKLGVRFYSNRLCKIKWQMKGSDNWVEYNGGEIQIEKTETLQFSAIDTCGRIMNVREEYYEIDILRQSVCPQDMGHVSIGDASFCVDVYEWPNKKGVRPSSFVSFYQAGDSCFSVGKRLCTSDEWVIACSGPYSYQYPYGEKYEKHACVTTDTVVHLSGKKPECRSFFGLYDMSGNLFEWTDSRSVENSSFYYVAGGFWDSGVKSSCSEKRYSYYTQNRHNPVGFRCCKSVSTRK